MSCTGSGSIVDSGCGSCPARYGSRLNIPLQVPLTTWSFQGVCRFRTVLARKLEPLRKTTVIVRMRGWMPLRAILARTPHSTDRRC